MPGHLPFQVFCGTSAGAINAIAHASSKTIVTAFVRREDMATAVSLNNVVFNVAGFVGPALAALLMAVIFMMILPLPPFLLDLLFTFNIAAALVVLLASVYTARALDFAAFPTVLLLTTLLRLSLNVASTRIVLLNVRRDAPGQARQTSIEQAQNSLPAALPSPSNATPVEKPIVPTVAPVEQSRAALEQGQGPLLAQAGNDGASPLVQKPQSAAASPLLTSTAAVASPRAAGRRR